MDENMPMIQINLLPKQYQKRSGGLSLGKQGKYVIVAAVGVLLMLGGITFYQMHQISELEDQMQIARTRTMQLQQDIQLVDALMDIKDKITRRLEAVERLDRNRSTWVRILEDLSRNVPDFVWLSNFTVEIEGFTFTLNALATFMIKMMRSDYFDEIDLASVNQTDFGNQKAYNFKLKARVHYLSDKELEEMAAKAAAESDAG
jgi:type IV pilus assembly protein PilN